MVGGKGGGVGKREQGWGRREQGWGEEGVKEGERGKSWPTKVVQNVRDEHKLAWVELDHRSVCQ